MKILGAFDLMLGSLYSVNASRRQVNGVGAWRQAALHTVNCSHACGEDDLGPGNPLAPAVTHEGWTDLAEKIVSALREHESRAERKWHVWQARAETAASQRDRMTHNAGLHADARQQWLRAAAAAGTPEQQSYCTAMAEQAEQATAACAAAAGAHEERRTLAVRKAGDALNWRESANHAAGTGRLLILTENGIAEPLIRVIANHRGLFAAAKTYHQIGGAA